MINYNYRCTVATWSNIAFTANYQDLETFCLVSSCIFYHRLDNKSRCLQDLDHRGINVESWFGNYTLDCGYTFKLCCLHPNELELMNDVFTS